MKNLTHDIDTLTNNMTMQNEKMATGIIIFRVEHNVVHNFIVNGKNISGQIQSLLANSSTPIGAHATTHCN